MLHAESRRYEYKVRCQPNQLAQVHAWVRLHSVHWRTTYPPRQVNNIYFDTCDHQCLNDNLGGIGSRQKLRLRWYGCEREIATDAHLELKCRAGSVGWKETCSLRPLPDGDSLVLDLAHQTWPDLRRIIQTTADARAKLWLDQFGFPVLINSYWRVYYATPDQVVRLTVDTKLEAFDQRYSVRPNLRRPSPVADYVIVEFKAGREHYSRLVDLLDNFPFRIDRSSKYVQGMLAAPDFSGVG